MKMRHEVKCILGFADYILLKNRLSKILPHDQHADAHGEYRVRSLYFDGPFDCALKDKTNGVERREKFRIRCYNEDFTTIRLEKKTKIGGMCSKKSIVLSEEEARNLIQGSIDFMTQDKEPLLIELYSKMKGRLLRPKTIVEYIREPFVYPAGNVRVTLDRDIRSGVAKLDFFSENPIQVPTDEAFAVLEVKYDQFLPDLVRGAIQFTGRKSSAFSKYAVCRKYD